MRKGLQKFRP